MDDDSLAAWLGDDFLARVSKIYVKKTTKQPVAQQQSAPVVTTSKDKKQRKDPNEFNKWKRAR